MTFRDPPTHTVDVETPAEAREALDAADTLGLELREVEVRGRWSGRDDGAEPSRGSTWSLADRTHDARKWFYLRGNGHETFAARPRSSGGILDRGCLELRFD